MAVHSGQDVFTAEVCNPGDHVEALAALVDGVGPGTALPSKAAAIQAAKSSGSPAAVCGQIGALLNSLGAESGIDPATAEAITSEARRVAAISGCPPH